MFVGRDEELEKLEKLYNKGCFQMVVVYGRRRVGKTTLISEFAKDKRTLFFTALEQSDRDNLSDLTARIREFFDLPRMTGSFESWVDAFDFIADEASKEPFVFVFDEFPYAAQRNISLPSILQIAIDHKLQETGLFLVLCGSNQGFMESKVLGRKSPLHGRRTSQMRVLPLDFMQAKKMLPELDIQEAFRYYGCFGGVPYYLSQIDQDLELQKNLERLYFDPTGFLYEEPLSLLRQELDEPALYNSILRSVAGGANKPNEISDKTGIAQTSLPRYLKTLIDLSILERVVPFSENPETSRRSIYRISEACYDFWFRFVMPYASEVESGLGEAVARAITDSELNSYLGRRFERVCAEWLVDQARRDELLISVTSVGSWWGTNPETKSQTNIDVVAANRVSKEMLIGECKYRSDFNVSQVIDNLEGKRNLVKGYKTSGLYVFSRHKIENSITAAYPDVGFVSLEDF